MMTIEWIKELAFAAIFLAVAPALILWRVRGALRPRHLGFLAAVGLVCALLVLALLPHVKSPFFALVLVAIIALGAASYASFCAVLFGALLLATASPEDSPPARRKFQVGWKHHDYDKYRTGRAAAGFAVLGGLALFEVIRALARGTTINMLVFLGIVRPRDAHYEVLLAESPQQFITQTVALALVGLVCLYFAVRTWKRACG